MKKVLALLILIIGVANAQPSAYVVNSLAETLSKFDLVTGVVHNHITILGETPNDIALANDTLYVVNSISASLQVIDPGTYETISTISLPIGSNPYSIEVSGGYAYVSGWVSGDIYRILLSENRIDNTLHIGGYPEGMLFFDGVLFVTQTAFNPSDFSYGQGQIAMIDSFSYRLAGEENVGSNPQSIMLQTGGLLHVVCTGNYSNIAGSVYIFNPYTDELEDSLLIGGQPVSGVIARNGVGYLAAGGWVDYGVVMSYNIHTKQILHNMTNPIHVGLGATDIAIDSSGFIYTSNFGSDNVTKLDSTGQILTTYQMGDGPQALVIWDDGFMDNVDDGNPSNSPSRSAIQANYPNPFNANTIIKYEITDGDFENHISIYDLQGRMVRKLSLGTATGKGEVIWDGRADNDVECASGIYLARLIGGPDNGLGNQRQAYKMVLVR